MQPTVPAHGTTTLPPAPPAPAIAAPPIDYTEVGTAEQYAQVAAAQAAQAAQAAAASAAAAAPVERPSEPAGQHAADIRAEVEHQLDREAGSDDPQYLDGSIAVPLVGSDGRRGVVHILETDEWPSDANSALHVGDYESWADGCLDGDDYEQVWCDLRPRLRQINDMFAKYRELTGQESGKSLRSPRSLRRAARK